MTDYNLIVSPKALLASKKASMVITRKVEFSASHVCRDPRLSDEENRQIYGLAANPHGHGHNYVLEVTVSGLVDQNGMVCNLVDLDNCVQREVVTRFDLENLNMQPEFAVAVPTTENLCTVIYDLLNQQVLKRKLGPVHLERVRLEETLFNSFEYDGN